MKAKKIILTFFSLFFLTSLLAQRQIGKERRDKIKSIKIAYLTKELSLTEKEAEKFWPIYNKHEERLEFLRKEKAKSIRKMRLNEDGISSLSEEESKQMLTKMMNLEEQLYQTNLIFKNKLVKVLSYKKILQLQLAERSFKRQMFNRLKRNKRQD